MKHHIFLVHGMGIHPTGVWANSVIEKIEEVAKRYEYFENRNVKDEINFIAVNYDELME